METRMHEHNKKEKLVRASDRRNTRPTSTWFLLNLKGITSSPSASS